MREKLRIKKIHLVVWLASFLLSGVFLPVISYKQLFTTQVCLFSELPTRTVPILDPCQNGLTSVFVATASLVMEGRLDLLVQALIGLIGLFVLSFAFSVLLVGVVSQIIYLLRMRGQELKVKTEPFHRSEGEA